MINLFNPKQTSKIGIISYVNPKTKEKVELPVYDCFWGNNYMPNIGQILVWLVKKGHTNTTLQSFTRIM